MTTAYINLVVGGIRQEESRVAPYFIAGAGFFRFSRAEFEVTDTLISSTDRVLADAENTFGIAAGGGVSISLNDRWSIFLEGKYQAGFTPQSSTQYFPVKVGLSFR